jgi:hypothetical protein
MFNSFLTVSGWVFFGFAAIAAIPAVVALRLKRLPASMAAAGFPPEWLAESGRPLVSVIVPAAKRRTADRQSAPKSAGCRNHSAGDYRCE